MSEAAAVRDTRLRQEAGARELALRRERAELPRKIAHASRKITDLRGEGRREGDPELEAALQAVRDLVDRERALPDAILDAAAQRISLEAEDLREREAALLSE